MHRHLCECEVWVIDIFVFCDIPIIYQAIRSYFQGFNLLLRFSKRLIWVVQEYKKQGYSESEAINLAGQWVAEPGTSEHQLGLAVDINGATYDIYLWLQENSYKYGFIFRYPGNKTHITNVAEEVWHYRYVGKEAAAEIHERGICLEEYLENPQRQNANDQSTQGQDSQGTDSQELPVQGETSYELRNGEWVIIDTSSP